MSTMLNRRMHLVGEEALVVVELSDVCLTLSQAMIVSQPLSMWLKCWMSWLMSVGITVLSLLLWENGSGCVMEMSLYFCTFMEIGQLSWVVSWLMAVWRFVMGVEAGLLVGAWGWGLGFAIGLRVCELGGLVGVGLLVQMLVGKSGVAGVVAVICA